MSSSRTNSTRIRGSMRRKFPTLYDPEQSVQLGAGAAVWRAVAVLVAAVVPAERFRVQRQIARRLWRRLADQPGRSCALLLARGRQSFACGGMRTDCRNIPMAILCRTIHRGRSACSGSHAAGRQMGIPVCKARSSLGVDGLASSVNLLLPDAIATGKLQRDSERRGARAARGSRRPAW